MTTAKIIALTIWTFVSKVMSVLFNMLSRFVITFLPRSKRLLISWLQSLSAVVLEPPKIKSLTLFIVSPSISQEVMGWDAMALVFWMLSFKPAFSLLFHPQEVLYFLFTFCHISGIICILYLHIMALRMGSGNSEAQHLGLSGSFWDRKTKAQADPEEGQGWEAHWARKNK